MSVIIHPQPLRYTAKTLVANDLHIPGYSKCTECGNWNILPEDINNTQCNDCIQAAEHVAWVKKEKEIMARVVAENAIEKASMTKYPRVRGVKENWMEDAITSLRDYQ